MIVDRFNLFHAFAPQELFTMILHFEWKSCVIWDYHVITIGHGEVKLT